MQALYEKIKEAKLTKTEKRIAQFFFRIRGRYFFYDIKRNRRIITN